MEKTVTFYSLPKTAGELKAMPGFSLADPFQVAAYGIAALCAWPENREESVAMLNLLKGPQPLTPFETQFIRDRFMDGKDYIPRSYFTGAVPGNNYTPAQPLSIVIKDNPYSRSEAGYIVLYATSGGADSPRQIKLRSKPSTGEWFLWSFEGILSGIRVPVADDPWA